MYRLAAAQAITGASAPKRLGMAPRDDYVAAIASQRGNYKTALRLRAVDRSVGGTGLASQTQPCFCFKVYQRSIPSAQGGENEVGGRVGSGVA